MFDFLQQEYIEQFLLTAGPFAPLVFIALQALQVVIAPIPMQVFGFAGGYVFGFIPGTLYSLIGLVLGTVAAVWLARKFGRPLVRRFVNEKTLKRFDALSSSNGKLILFLIFLFPGLPDDAICFIAGLSPIRIRDVATVAALGRLPGIAALALFGEQISQGEDPLMIIVVISVVTVLLGIGYIYKDKMLKRFMPAQPSDEES